MALIFTCSTWFYQPLLQAHATIKEEMAPKHLFTQAQAHLDSVRKSALGQDWQYARLDSQPVALYRPDIQTPAYYEFKVLSHQGEQGFIVVSTGPHDFDIAHFSTQGPSPTERIKKANHYQAARYYKLDTLTYVAETPLGLLDEQQQIKDTFIRPFKNESYQDRTKNWATHTDEQSMLSSEYNSLEKKDNIVPHYDVWTWNDLKTQFADLFDAPIKQLQEQVKMQKKSNIENQLHLSSVVASSTWDYAWTQGNSALYHQISSGDGPNNSSCASGCGATAWAILLGWIDTMAAGSVSPWETKWGTYRQNGGYGVDAVAPFYMDYGISQITWEIRNHIGTFCSSSQGATLPNRMVDVVGYLNGRVGLRVSTKYNLMGFNVDSIRDEAINAIVYRHTPAIIGTGFLQHYPVAIHYAKNTRTMTDGSTEFIHWFFINQAWGDSAQNGWIRANTWFYGSILPE